MRRRAILATIGVVAATGVAVGYWLMSRDAAGPRDIAVIRATVQPRLAHALSPHGASVGDPMLIRIFKETKELEVWVRGDRGYRLFRTYPICAYSGTLGPKLKEGDGQAPEGFYRVGLSALNPQSSYHLSFNLGFPNAFDRAHGRSGSFLMVHGRCVSIGCYAMTDPVIEEIYVMVEATARATRSEVPVHIFPFRMTTENMTRHAGSPWIGFWQTLKPAYDAFEASRQPPRITVSAGQYVTTR
jgi:murein L,D-transpeptidase YafK